MKKIFIILILAIIFLAGGLFFYRQNKKPDVITIDLPPAQNYQDFVSSTATIIPEPEETEEPAVEPPTSINLAVPFTSQAPTKNWEQPWQDACEEASILMVDYFYRDQDFPEPTKVEDLLSAIIDWEITNWGGHENLPTARVSDLVHITFGYETKIIEDLDATKIKYWLDRGVPVIVPADGHKLNNPHFTGSGPDYHMLVIKGYVDDKFITNDPGTQYGADFVYTSANLLMSIGDWDIQKTSAAGKKLGLVLLK